MKYSFVLDKDKYILSMYEDPEGIDLPENFDFAYINCYRLIDDEIVLDESKIEAEEEENARQQEIFELKQKLNETDYIFARELEEITTLSNPLTFITDFIAILVKYSTLYAETIANRKKWRKRIEELGG